MRLHNDYRIRNASPVPLADFFEKGYMTHKGLFFRKIRRMHTVLFYLLLVSLFATLTVLGVGLASLGRGGAFSKKYGNRLMQWRVGMQVLTILLLILYISVPRS